MSGALVMLAQSITGRWAWVFVVVPLFLAGLILGGVGEADAPRADTYLLPDGRESTIAADLAAQMPRDKTEVAIVLWSADSGTLDAAAIRQANPDLAERLTVAQDQSAAMAVVPIDAGDADKVGGQVDDLRADLRKATPDGVDVAVTGPAGFHADLGKVFEGADMRLLLATMGIVALLLVITYRSPVLWLVPLIVVGIADRVAVVAGSRLLDLVNLPFDGTTGGILSVLVFGAGTDYALLLISRYRDELRLVADRREAMAHALRRTAEAVLGSALTVFVAVLTLLLSLTPGTRGIGLACAVGIVIAAAFALIVLPAVLVLLGRWVFWPMVPRTGEPIAADRPSFYSHIGSLVSRRPVMIATGTIVLLAVLASGFFGVRLGLDESDQLLDQPESVTAAQRLSESFPAGTTEPILVVTKADPEAVAARIRATDGIASVTVSGQGAGISELSVITSSEAGSASAAQSIERLRKSLDDVAQTYVGGPQAEVMDQRDAAGRDLRMIVPPILILVLIGLMALFRSLVGPIVLVASVVGTYCAALGASWWIFTHVFDFPAIAAPVPLLAFLFLVALGVDYNIFLVTRAREERAEHGSRGGMLRALTATGGVITSAGVLLAAVFAVLGVLPLVALAQLGTIICLGVLIDTLIVRTMFVPAAAMLLGDRFWWPGVMRGARQG